MDRGIYGSAKSVVVMLISVAVSSRGSIAQRIPSDEVAALKTISEKLNNTYWKNVSETSCSDNGITFNTSIAPGIFSNVTCDCSFNSGTVCHVKNIDLSRNYINGSIPASLCKIPLVNIALVGNRISGPIPDEFGNISTLQQANFEDNQFSGQLPASLENLSNLQRLLLQTFSMEPYQNHLEPEEPNRF